MNARLIAAATAALLSTAAHSNVPQDYGPCGITIIYPLVARHYVGDCFWLVYALPISYSFVYMDYAINDYDTGDAWADYGAPMSVYIGMGDGTTGETFRGYWDPYPTTFSGESVLILSDDIFREDNEAAP